MATIHEINEDWQQHGLAATWLKLQKAQGEHDALAAELQKWRDVFGHLGTADECGNEWIRLQDRIAELEQANRRTQ